MLNFFSRLFKKNTHEVKETLEVDVLYPDHVQRTASALFEKSRRHIIEQQKTPCMVCGTNKDLELHHWFVEWAYSDAVDWDKMKKLHPDFDWATFKEAADFVDSEYNLRVLCQKHHRAKFYGIHMIPFPNWYFQLAKRDDFDFSPEK
jgi:hypothetical protein